MRKEKNMIRFSPYLVWALAAIYFVVILYLKAIFSDNKFFLLITWIIAGIWYLFGINFAYDDIVKRKSYGIQALGTHVWLSSTIAFIVAFLSK